MNKTALLSAGIVATSIFWTSTALGVNVGDRVYGVFGTHDSNLRAVAGHVKIAGSSSSKVDWEYCYDCNEWIDNSGLWYSQSSAQEYVERRDSEHTSLGEAAGAAAGLGLLYLLLESD